MHEFSFSNKYPSLIILSRRLPIFLLVLLIFDVGGMVSSNIPHVTRLCTNLVETKKNDGKYNDGFHRLAERKWVPFLRTVIFEKAEFIIQVIPRKKDVGKSNITNRNIERRGEFLWFLDFFCDSCDFLGFLVKKLGAKEIHCFIHEPYHYQELRGSISSKIKNRFRKISQI